jgi:hypothetical protein
LRHLDDQGSQKLIHLDNVAVGLAALIARINAERTQ